MKTTWPCGEFRASLDLQKKKKKTKTRQTSYRQPVPIKGIKVRTSDWRLRTDKKKYMLQEPFSKNR